MIRLNVAEKGSVEYFPNHFSVVLDEEATAEEGVVASKNGTKYYYSHCSGVGRIKEENRVYFSDNLAAEKAGYEIAKNCK